MIGCIRYSHLSFPTASRHLKAFESGGRNEGCDLSEGSWILLVHRLYESQSDGSRLSLALGLNLYFFPQYISRRICASESVGE